ncbi:MAG: hypothetical protein ACR2HO_06350 [Rubrobacteraceae bacterium]
MTAYREPPALITQVMEFAAGWLGLGGAKADASEKELRRISPDHPVFRLQFERS